MLVSGAAELDLSRQLLFHFSSQPQMFKRSAARVVLGTLAPEMLPRLCAEKARRLVGYCRCDDSKIDKKEELEKKKKKRKLSYY